LTKIQLEIKNVIENRLHWPYRLICQQCSWDVALVRGDVCPTHLRLRCRSRGCNCWRRLGHLKEDARKRMKHAILIIPAWGSIEMDVFMRNLICVDCEFELSKTAPSQTKGKHMFI